VVSGELYCRRCRKAILAELKDAGFLTRVPKPKYRPPESQENTWETKFGKDR